MLDVKLVIPIILAVTLPAAGQTSRSVGEGVYTSEQANRGKTLYADQCASCHGAELGGGEETPALAGAGFLAHWNNRSVDQLFERVRVSMPPDRPGTLSRQMVADLLAYIFIANRFPAGSAELTTRSEALNQIQFEARLAPGQPPPTTPSRGGNANVEPAPALVEGQPIDRRPPEKSDNQPAFPEQTRAPYHA